MIYTVVDVETSGTQAYFDDVHSFGYLSFDASNNRVIDSGVLYFYKEDMRWTEGAYQVHGLTKEFLKQFENEFDDNLAKMYKLVQRGNLVGYYSDQFDLPCIANYLKRNGFDEVPLNKNMSIDIAAVYRPIFKKRMKLTLLRDVLEIPEAGIKLLFETYFSHATYSPTAHDAAYDVVVTYFCYVYAKQRGWV